MNIDIQEITGLILAGGRGSRMGGVDKGLQDYLGVPLALYALRRLGPQVGGVVINANRNIAAYEAMGARVVPDEIPDFAGPLAGMIAGLKVCETPYLATVPCDTPNFPLDLVQRLSRGLADVDADMAMAFAREEGVPRRQPVFSLMKTSLLQNAIDYVASGQGNVGYWASQQRCAQVVFDDAGAFFNANTLADLAKLQTGAN